MAIPAPVELALFIGALIGLLVAAALSRRNFLFALGFLMPLMMPRLEIGIGLDWHKLIGPLALAMALLGRRAGPPGPTRTVGWLALYASIVTFVWMALEYTVLQRYRLATWMGLGEAQSFYKMPVQLGTFLSMLTAALAVPLLARSSVEVRAAIRGCVSGATVSLVFGLGLLATTGRGMLADRTAFFGLDGARVVRIGGLSGEPKGLGAILVVAILYLLASYLFSSTTDDSARGMSPRVRIFLVFGLTAGLFMTYSTSAWAGFVAGVVVVAALVVLRTRRTRMGRAVVVAGAAAVVLASSSFVLEVAQSRFVDRLFGRSSEVERQKDAFMLQAFEREPWNALWGYGLGGADLEVVPMLPWNELQYRRTPTAGTTGMKILGDLGVLGVLGCLFIFVGWSRRLWRSGDATGSAFVLAGGVAVMFCAHLALPLVLFIAGAHLALTTTRDAEARVRIASSPIDARDPALAGSITLHAHGVVSRQALDGGTNGILHR